MKNAVIIGAQRTPIGSFMGALASVPVHQLGACALLGALKQSGLKHEFVSEVIMGQVLQGGCGQAPARQATLAAGLSNQVPATTVNKVCGSGLKAIMLANQAISLGDAIAVLAGGMESMSNAPYILSKAREGMRLGHQQALDLMIHDGLFDPYGQAHMGNFGDLCALEHQFSREAQDTYAKQSYEKARLAIELGYFQDEITPVLIKTKAGELTISADEEPLRYAPEKMASLKPAFSSTGTVTAANASKLNDGAAAVLLSSEELACSQGLTIQARIIGSTTVAGEPQWFTTAPAAAIKKVLAQTGLRLSDIDLFEINEAFSVVTMHSIKELALDPGRVNIFGGAVALGHPIGSSGARLVVTLLNALEKKNKRYGCVSICLGGGEAVAMIIERV